MQTKLIRVEHKTRPLAVLPELDQPEANTPSALRAALDLIMKKLKPAKTAK